MRAIIFIFVLCTLLPTVASADTTTINDGCVKYLATGKVYEVRVHIVDGTDLWPKYKWANVLHKYAIVFWADDQATVIDLGVFGLLMDTGVTGKDLDGRQWKVAKRLVLKRADHARKAGGAGGRVLKVHGHRSRSLIPSVSAEPNAKT